MPATMDDVAKEAGVSKAAVSMALNNKPGISPGRKQAILQVADQLGYRLPSQRPGRRSAETKTLTVVHCVGKGPDSQAHPFGIYVEYLRGIETYVQEHNLRLTVIASYRDGEQESLGGHLLNDEKLASGGLILMGMGLQQNSPLIHRIQAEKIPAVVLSRNWPHLPISTVSQDHYQQAQIALDYLLELGHRKIAFIAREVDRRYDWFDWRLECYRATMQRFFGQVDDSLIVLGVNGAKAAKTLMRSRPDVTAVFAVNDVSAVSVMRGLQEMGLNIPENVSVIGLDDSTFNPEKYPASLTTVIYPHCKVGYLAAELLQKQMLNQDLYYANILVQSQLVERASCAKPGPP